MSPSISGVSDTPKVGCSHILQALQQPLGYKHQHNEDSEFLSTGLLKSFGPSTHYLRSWTLWASILCLKNMLGVQPSRQPDDTARRMLRPAQPWSVMLSRRFHLPRNPGKARSIGPQGSKVIKQTGYVGPPY